MPGEVYALGIVYVFANGNITPVYHIPGRPKGKYLRNGTVYSLPSGNDDMAISTSSGYESKDTTFYANTEYHDDTLDPDYGASHIERWKVYDTSYSISSNARTTSFYRTTHDYVYDNRGCGVNNYWGKDFAGDDLVGQPIRHHRIPDRTRGSLITSGASKYVHQYNAEITASNPNDTDCIVHYQYTVDDGSSTTTVSDSYTLTAGVTSDVHTIEDSGLKTGTGNMFYGLTVSIKDESGNDCSSACSSSITEQDKVTSESSNYGKYILV